MGKWKGKWDCRNKDRLRKDLRVKIMADDMGKEEIRDRRAKG